MGSNQKGLPVDTANRNIHHRQSGRCMFFGFVFMLAVALYLLFSPVCLWAAPFAKYFQFTQPDGVRLTLWGEGDEFHAIFETTTGYTVVFDPEQKAYFYAERAADGKSLISSGVFAHEPAPPGLAQHVRMDHDAVVAVARARRKQWDAETGLSERWSRLKSQTLGTPLSPDEVGVLPLPPAVPTIGTKIGLTLLVDFPDDPATISQTEIEDLLNSDSYTGFGNNGSVKNYFYDVSGSRLTYTNVVTIYVRMTQPKSYYDDTSKDSGTQHRLLINDALAILMARSDYNSTILPTFSALTTDGSGYVVAFNVFYAGTTSSAWGYGLWPATGGVGPVPLGNGKSVYIYQISDIFTSPGIGTFCHENGHMLCGFPDIYDYDFDSMGGAASFSLMGFGNNPTNPSQVDAYLKLAAGWATVTDLDGTSNLIGTLVAAPNSGYDHFYRYRRPGVATEYFLLENRQKTGRDAILPAAGIAVWHVDELGDKDNQSMVPNSTHLNYELTLVQADNQWHFQNNVNVGDAFDLYYQGNSAALYTNRLDDSSAPNTHWWDGTTSGMNLNGFSVAGTSMTFNICSTQESCSGMISFDSANYSVNENGGGSVLVTVTRTGASMGAVGVSYAASNGTATAGPDYTAASGTLSWANGDTANKTFSVPITSDALNESNETFTVTLSSPTGGATLGSPSSSTVTITDDDPAPTVEFSAASSSGSEATTPASIGVTLSAPSGQTVKVNYATANGTATAGSDYTATSGTLTFNPGVTSQTISVPIINDTAVEGDETFTVTLSGPVNATLGATTTHTYAIINDDNAGTLQFSSATYGVNENGGSVLISVARTGGSTGTVGVSYATSNGTAAAVSDYTFTSGTLSWTNGDTANKTFSVPITNDTLDEANETFTVTLSSPTGGATLGSPSSATVTITDDDPTPTVQFSAASSSGSEATTPALMTVTLSAVSGQTVTVSYATANVTATAGSDYTATSGTLTFNPGVTNQTISVPIINDTAVEDNETFTVTLSGPVNATLGAIITHTYTINNDDNAGTLRFSSATYTVNESSGSVLITVTRTGASSGAVGVSYATSNGTATTGSDYTSTSGTLSWANGDTANKTFSVSITNDTLDESNETFAVTLSNLTGGASLGSPSSATVTVIDDDPTPTVQFSAASSSGSEATTPASLTVTLSAASGQTVTVSYATANGTATAGSDYTATSGTLTFNPGVTNQTINVPITNDALDEPNETFTVTLSSPTGGATLGSSSSATATIIDDDPVPTVQFGAVSLSGSEAKTPASIGVTLSAPSGQTVKVNYVTANGTATAGSDYTATSGTLTFNPGVTVQTINVPIINDTAVEGNESFTVTLSGPVNATLGPIVTHTYTINEDVSAPSAQWVAAYGGLSDDIANSIQETQDGGYIVAGETSSFGAGDYDAWILKLTDTGLVSWQKTYGGSGYDSAKSIQQTTDGGYIVAGYTDSFGNGEYDCWILKLTSTGTISWQRTYGGSSYDYCQCIQQTTDGGYIVAGYTYSFGNGDGDYWILKLTGTGAISWEKTYGGSDDDRAYSIQQTADGGYIVTGESGGWLDPAYHTWIVKLTNTGDISWQKAYTGGSDSDSILQTADGGYIVNGAAPHLGGWILKLTSTGEVSWQKAYGGPGGDFFFPVQQSSDGGYVMAGYSKSWGAGDRDVWVLKLTSTGAVSWEKTYGGPDLDEAESIQQTSDGGYIVAGETSSFGAGGSDVWILKLDGNGNVKSCGAEGVSTASVSDTATIPTETTVTPSNSAATTSNSSATVTNTTVSQNILCVAAPEYTLSVIKSGLGTVTSDPAGIDCGVDCSESYAEDTVVTLTAKVDPGSVFAGWSGGGCSGKGLCVLTINNNTRITATFIHNTAPTPNPMTWVTPPYQTGTTSISMVASTVTDPAPPISYYFDFVGSPTGGLGGKDSGWQPGTSYINSNLRANHKYGYRGKAKDGSNNQTAYSTTQYAYTAIQAPTGITFGTITPTSIQVRSTNTPTGLSSGSSGLFIENTTNATNSGWKRSNSPWTSKSLTPNTSYSFQAKARNGDGIETDYGPSASKYTRANLPGKAPFSDVTRTSIRANWTDNGNPPGTQYLCQNLTTKTDLGWTTETYWDSNDLACSSSYSFRVKAKNQEEVETGWTSLGSQSTVKCVHLLNPNGGEIIPSGSSGYDIQWEATPVAESFDLFYSLDGGEGWTSIAKDVRNTIYPWTVPKTVGNKKACLVRVIGYNAARTKKIGSDTSDKPFTIEVVKLTSPNGGPPPLKQGESIDITWTAYETTKDIKKVQLYYTKDGGANWILIPPTLIGNYPPGDYSQPWTIPPVGATAKTKCKVKVVLKDEKGLIRGSDVSDNFFTIEP